MRLSVQQFETSPECTSRASCTLCRDRRNGVHFRQMMMLAYRTSDGPTTVDFRCVPLGLPFAEGVKPACACRNCGSEEHRSAACPIPADYDGNYRLDSKGTEGCGC